MTPQLTVSTSELGLFFSPQLLAIGEAHAVLGRGDFRKPFWYFSLLMSVEFFVAELPCPGDKTVNATNASHLEECKQKCERLGEDRLLLAAFISRRKSTQCVTYERPQHSSSGKDNCTGVEYNNKSRRRIISPILAARQPRGVQCSVKCSEPEVLARHRCSFGLNLGRVVPVLCVVPLPRGDRPGSCLGTGASCGHGPSFRIAAA